MSKNEQAPRMLEKDLNEKAKQLSLKENELNKLQRDLLAEKKEINSKQAELAAKELEIINGLPKEANKYFAKTELELKELQKKLLADNKTYLSQVNLLNERTLQIQEAELKRDQGYALEKQSLLDELYRIKKEHQDSLAERENQFKANIDENLKNYEQKCRLEIEQKIAQLLADAKGKIELETDALHKAQLELNHEKSELATQLNKLDYDRRVLQAKEELLGQQKLDLDKQIEEELRVKKESFESQLAIYNSEIEALRSELSSSMKLINQFKLLERKLNNQDPAAVLNSLNEYEMRITDLREELIKRPPMELKAFYETLQAEQHNNENKIIVLEKENLEIKRALKDQSVLEFDLETEKHKTKQLETAKAIIEKDAEFYKSEIKRLQASYEREADRDTRIADIEKPYLEKIPSKFEEKMSEIAWLDRIQKECNNYGLYFPKRILYAFHTALKTSEWSPLTVLAGVSGTGKSELPRLYSHFGGLNFLSLAVQPNWDSQESMLGFFNSIDNQFDAQPVLRFLAQSQKKASKDYPYGLNEMVNIVLLDEMNLAHVELYFAEFLSKLEQRRGAAIDNIPHLSVKLGSGIVPYKLTLDRNVLWTGTMNQDETTKSLSDKVLDRGIVINFPRPSTLERRKNLEILKEQTTMLSRNLWDSWIQTKSQFEDTEISPFKNFIEEMNESLANVGRSLGHRVWQSIEYYMVNYPTVISATNDEEKQKALKIAFEDQLVQKVMPKLRGIETRGKAKSDCLDKIKQQLSDQDYSILADFEHACTVGYGQFIWSSANYMKE